MWFQVLALWAGVSGGVDQDILDNIIKARLELARQELAQACPPGPQPKAAPVKPEATPKPPAVKPLPPAYQLAHMRAMKEGKPLLVLVGGSKPNTCNKYGCFPIPSRFIVCKVDEFPDIDNEGQMLKSGIIVSAPEKGELNYKGTLPDHCTIQQIDNVINPILTVGSLPNWSNCST